MNYTDSKLLETGYVDETYSPDFDKPLFDKPKKKRSAAQNRSIHKGCQNST